MVYIGIELSVRRIRQCRIFEHRLDVTQKSQQEDVLRILVIDDDKDIIELIEIALGDLELNVISCNGGKEGLQKFYELGDEVALILLDIAMSEINGLEVLERIRDRNIDTPVLIMSGYFVSKNEAVSLRANDVVVKPFKIDELKRQVIQLLL